MLRDWTDSDKIKLLSVHAERFFVRLIMKADDYGCLFANISLLKASLFPLMLDGVREADISRWMAECQKAGLIVLYEATGKRYLQIQDFRQRLDKAKNKYPLPNSTDFPEVVNEFRAELETEVEVEKEKNTGTPSAPHTRSGESRGDKKKIMPPTHQQVATFFKATVGDPQHPQHWPEDKCYNQAGLFVDHYETNGWVQGKNKPIKNWQAAGRNWIRHEIQGIFKPPDRPKRDEKPTPPRTHQVYDGPKLNDIQRELNAMYELWLDNSSMVTVISITADHYNFLKSTHLVAFSQEEVQRIKAHVQQYMTDHQLEGDIVGKRLMKAYGVLEFFKQNKTLGMGTLFLL
jgi:hypothetical protein